MANCENNSTKCAPESLQNLAFGVKYINGNNLFHILARYDFSQPDKYYSDDDVDENCNDDDNVHAILTAMYEQPVNEPNDNGFCPLHTAVWTKNEPFVRHLLSIFDKKIDVNCLDKGNRTPLFIAAECGHYMLAEILLKDARVEVNLRNEMGYTPFHVAVGNGHEAIAKKLLEFPVVDINKVLQNGLTSLHYAAVCGYSGLVNKMLKVPEILVNEVDGLGRTPLHIAVEYGYYNVVSELLKDQRVSLNVQDKDGFTALHASVLLGHNVDKKRMPKIAIKAPVSQAIEYNCIKVVEELLKASEIPINAQDMVGRTALHLTARFNEYNIAKELLKHPKILVNIRDTSGETALQVAVKKGFELVVKHLLKARNILIDDVDVEKDTIYQNSVSSENANGVSKVLGNASNVRDSIPSLLHLAVKYDRYKVVIELLKDGRISANEQNINGDTPLHVAVKNGNLMVVKELVRKLEMLDYKKTSSARVNKLNCVNSAQQIANASELLINVKDSKGRTALHLAAEYGYHYVAIELLRAEGILINTQDMYGNTPLHAAVQTGHCMVVMELLTSRSPDKLDCNGKVLSSRGNKWCWFKWTKEIPDEEIPDDELLINMKDQKGRTALHLAAEYGHCSIINELLKAKRILLNLKDIHGNTALHTAVENDRCTAVMELLNGVGGVDPLFRCTLNETFPEIVVNLVNKESLTPLHLAVKYNRVDIVMQLLYFKRTSKDTLYVAVRENYGVKMRKLLEAYEILINDSDKIKRTPLHYCALYGCKVITEQILKVPGICVNEHDAFWTTPLHLAAEHGHCYVVQALLKDERISINECNRQHRTALHLAAINGQKSVFAELLKDARISLLILDWDGHSAIEEAKMKIGNEAVLRILNQKEIKDNFFKLWKNCLEEKVSDLDSYDFA